MNVHDRAALALQHELMRLHCSAPPTRLERAALILAPALMQSDRHCQPPDVLAATAIHYATAMLAAVDADEAATPLPNRAPGAQESP